MSKTLNGERIVKVCPSCGKEFETLKSRNKKYCSQRCNEERNEKYMNYYCDCCGKEMRIKKLIYQEKLDGKRKNIYCSRECADNGKRNGSDIECDNCGKIFYRIQAHIDRQHQRNQNNFCSMKCQQEYRHTQKFEWRKCEVCGELFEVSKTSTQRLCSYECQHKWQSLQTRELNSRFQSILTPCTYCGKEHYVKPYKFNIQDNFFCSIECRQKWYSEIYSQTEENKVLQRDKILRQLENGSLSNVNSKPQLIVNTILDDMEVEYKREAGFEYWAIDNYLIECNLAIEVQGNYWHANPIIFDDKLTKVQYDRIHKDKRKRSYFKNQYNMEILYLWESDIMNDVKLCEKLIAKYIENNGVLKNYHSFNYHIENDELKINDILITPYQEMEKKQYQKLLIV